MKVRLATWIILRPSGKSDNVFFPRGNNQPRVAFEPNEMDRLLEGGVFGNIPIFLTNSKISDFWHHPCFTLIPEENQKI